MKTNERELKQVVEALGGPREAAVAGSRRRVEAWFAETAPLIAWDVIDSPLLTAPLAWWLLTSWLS